VSSDADWRRVVRDTTRAFGRLDVLVNDAGIGITGDVEHATLDDWHRLMRINLDGVFLGMQHAIPAIRQAGGGSIINMSSIEGVVGDPTLAAYNASKGAVRRPPFAPLGSVFGHGPSLPAHSVSHASDVSRVTTVTPGRRLPSHRSRRSGSSAAGLRFTLACTT
jgi:NAD(P)-dependent dehydrogenase (short-subunit alcohol dehydrogenase family)